LFLDSEGTKISKSKGNGLSMDEWLKYAPSESLAYYMFQSPKRAKRLFFDVIPAAMDEYIDLLAKFLDSSEEARVDNPVFHIHNGKPPRLDGCLRYSLMLNLVQACSTSSEEVLMEFIKRYLGENASQETLEFMKKMAKFAIVYYNDFIANTRVPETPNEVQKKALIELREFLKKGPAADTIQNEIFEIGKRNFDTTKEWFETLYKVLFGASSGPKMGTFISLYGLENTIKLIDSRIKE
jgi:lysyl-tRNA synthetase class 1